MFLLDSLPIIVTLGVLEFYCHAVEQKNILLIRFVYFFLTVGNKWYKNIFAGER